MTSRQTQKYINVKQSLSVVNGSTIKNLGQTVKEILTSQIQ